MLEIAIMLEGQMGLTWPRLEKIAALAEEKGFAGLYRSDHYTNSGPPDQDSLECWVSLAWLASNTSRLEFGPLVSPVSFRQPTMLARMAASVDDLSGGRLRLGVGAGWQEREHTNYSWDLLSVKRRMDRLEEGLHIISQMLKSDSPTTFEGNYYQVHDAILLPRPQRKGGPPIVIGGNGPKRTLPLVAKFGDEWNSVYLPPERFSELSDRLDELLEEQGRPAESVRRTMMTGVYFGRSEAELVEWASARNTTPEAIRARGAVFGTATQIVDQLGGLSEAGLQRVMLQWLDLDDLDRLADMADAILPHF